MAYLKRHIRSHFNPILVGTIFLTLIVSGITIGHTVHGDAPPPGTALIDFEKAPGPDGILGTPDDVTLNEFDVIDDEYASLGVTFSLVGPASFTGGSAPIIATEGGATAAFVGPGGTPDAPTPSPVNSITPGAGLGPCPCLKSIQIDFAFSVSSVSLSILDFDSIVGQPLDATAFNASGNVIDVGTVFSLGYPGGDGNIQPVSVSGSGIRRVILDFAVNDNGLAIDDLSFEAPSEPPGPACGITVTGDLTLDRDLVCAPGFVGIVLIVAADGIVIDGAGFDIIAPNAPIGINLTSGNNNVTIRDISIESKIGIRVTGGGDNTIENVDTFTAAPRSSTVGFQIVGSSRNMVVGSTAGGYAQGVRLQGNSDNNEINTTEVNGNSQAIWLDGDADSNVVDGNDLSGNNQAVYGSSIITGSGNQFINNDMSDSAGFAIVLAKDEGFVISGNDFTNSFSGIHLINMTGITLSNDDVDLSTLRVASNGVGVQLDGVTDSLLIDLSIPSFLGVRVRTGGGNEIHGVDVSWGSQASKLGIGFQIIDSSDNDVVDTTASNHSEGIRFDNLSEDNRASCSAFTANTIGVVAKSTFVSASVANSLIQDNGTGVLNQAPVVLLAENNYWGSADGASPPGGGDTISGNIDADPFVATSQGLDASCGRNLPPVTPGGAVDGFVWVGNGNDRTVSKIDKSTNTIVATIGPLSREIESLAVDNESVWVGTREFVYRIDKATGSIIAQIPVAGVQQAGIAVDPTHVWASGFSGNIISKIDKSTNSVVATILVGRQPMGVAVDPNFVWVAQFTGGVSVIDKATNSVVATIDDIGSRPTDVAVDHESIWVTNSETGRVARVDKDTSEVDPISWTE